MSDGLPKEDQEFINKNVPNPEEKMPKQELNEAPTSITYSIITPKGYPALLTARDTELSGLAKKMVFIEDMFEKNGYKPQVRGFAKKEIKYVEGKMCPKCGGRMVEKTKRNGGIFHQCENKKWDAIQNKNVGTCDYTDWLNPKATYDKYDEGNTPSEESY